MTNIMPWYHVAMGLGFLVIGTLLLVSPPPALTNKTIPTEGMAGFAYAYGAFRLLRGIQAVRKHRREGPQSGLHERRKSLFEQRREED